ncbi:hypothetical protein ACLEPN_32115 [Myxococcus sp. 1LA]
MAIRTPMQRIGLVLFVPFLLFGLVEIVRVWMGQTPRLMPADECSPGFSLPDDLRAMVARDFPREPL